MGDLQNRPEIDAFELKATGAAFGHHVQACLIEGPAGRPLAKITINHPDDSAAAGNFSMTALQTLIRDLQGLRKSMRELNKESYRSGQAD